MCHYYRKFAIHSIHFLLESPIDLLQLTYHLLLSHLRHGEAEEAAGRTALHQGEQAEKQRQLPLSYPLSMCISPSCQNIEAGRSTSFKVEMSMDNAQV